MGKTTPEEIYNVYVFKLIKRILKKKYKFDNRSFDLGTWHINRKEGETPYMSI
jgi:hypothetical protein